MKTLYFDCFSGAAGDMLLGALIDVGVPLDDVRDALGALAIDRDTVWTERVTRAGVSATKFCVAGEAARVERHSAPHGHHHHHEHGHSHAHAHEHDHSHTDHHSHNHGGHHPHRSLAEIRSLIDGSRLGAAGKTRAKDLFQRLGEAEAAIHGMPVDQVHLHEVGALDSIVDIVGTVYAMEALGVEDVIASPLNVGSGTVKSAHGLYPVPAPATTRLLQGAPIYAGDQRVELVTPTGALLVTGYARAYGPVPPMRLTAVGYGAGTRDLPNTPNVVRVLVGEAERTGTSQQVVVLEAEIDDMSPQLFGPVMDELFVHGALDVFLTPVQMKKSRPGTLLTVIAPPEARARLSAMIFRSTTTIGLRYREMAREVLDRETVRVATPFGEVRMKVATRGGERLNVAPEFDDCLALAKAGGHAVKDVQAAAMKAFLDRPAS